MCVNKSTIIARSQTETTNQPMTRRQKSHATMVQQQADIKTKRHCYLIRATSKMSSRARDSFVIVSVCALVLISSQSNISNAIYITGPSSARPSIVHPSQSGAGGTGSYPSSLQDSITTSEQLSMAAGQMQPPSITPFWFNQNVQENNRLSVLCVITSGDLPVHISWLKDGQLLTPPLAQARKIIIKSDEDQSTLKFQSVKLDHAGNYTCMARNRAGSQSHSAQLIVHGEPRWLKEPQHEPIVATRGQTIVIDCQTTGWPKPQQSWLIKPHLQGDFEPVAATGRISLAANGSLVIRNADKSDEANYLCKSFNGIGRGISWSTSLKVNVPAHFESPKQQTNVVRRQSPVQLRCDAFGDEPITIEWYKNKQRLSNEVEPRYSIYTDQLQNRLVSQLLIKQVQRQDNSVYECVTKNSVGRDRLAIDLIVQEEPDNIHELQATQIGSRSVQLMWNEPYDGRSSITQYMFQYKRVQDASSAPVASSSLSSPSTISSSSSSPSSSITPLSSAGSAAGVANDVDFIDSISAMELAAAAAAGAKQQVIPLATSTSSVTMQNAIPLDNDWQQASRLMVPVQPQQNASSSAGTGNGNSIRSYTIEKLEPSSKYVLRALAINAIGQSKFSQPMEFNTEEEAPEIGPTNIRAVAINSTSIQVSWDEIPKHKQLGRIHGYYIGYRVTSLASNNLNNTQQNFIYKPYIINDLVFAQQQQQQQQHHSNYDNHPQRLETVVHDLRRDTAYEITVVAFNSRGSGPLSDSVVCKTIEMEAPKPVKLQIRRESNESIFIEWQRDPNDQNPVDDYILYQEKNSASQEWLQVRLPGNQTQYKAPGLKCGTRYQFYIIAHNKVGKSQPSEVVSASTSGALPVIPSKTSLIKMINSTCLLVNLNSFQDNGCRIKTFTVRYRVDKLIAANQQAGNGMASGASSSLVSANGMAASQGALVAAANSGAGAAPGAGGAGKAHQSAHNSANSAASTASAAAVIAAGSSTSAGAGAAPPLSSPGGTPEWITVRPRSSQGGAGGNKHNNPLLHHHTGHHHYQRVSYEEDRMEYLCDLSPIGEYTIHVAAANDVGRSEIEYSVLMSSDELRHSALNDLVEFLSSMPNVFIYVPSIIVFLIAGLFMSLASIVLYTTALKYYQKFVIMHNQLRATRRAKQDEKRRRKLNSSQGNRHSQKLDLWADEYDEDADGDVMMDADDVAEGDDEHDDADDDSSAGSSNMSHTQHHNNSNRRHHQMTAHHHHHHTGHLLGRAQHNHHHSRPRQQQQHGHRHQSPAQLAAALNGGHYLANIANSAFETSSIDSHACVGNKFGGPLCSGMSTASTDSIQGRFQCLNSRQYVKMNEYTMLPSISANLSSQTDLYGTAGSQSTNATTSTTATTRRSPQQQKQTPPLNNAIYNPMYSTLRRTSMQTYLPQQPGRSPQQQSPMNNRRQSQNMNDIYGYYIAPAPPQPNQSASIGQQQVAAAANEAANSIFVPPQQIIYSAPNLRRQPPVFL